MATTLNFTTEDIDYLHHGDRAMAMKLFRPAGAGPFPIVIDLHGGAWNKSDLASCIERDEAFAEAGIAAAAIDFRHAADGYPASLIDINYATRWIKAHAGELDLDPNRIGLCGQSSGGHLAMLSAMRPFDERYASIPLNAGTPDLDATVRCVGMAWPVMNPLSRYRNALRTRAGEVPGPTDWVGDIPESHDIYWVTDENMSEGNPVLLLERGEKVLMPPAMWVQGRPDPVHDYRDPESPVELNEPERFSQNYRNAGGDIELVYIEQKNRYSPTSFEPLTAFFRKHLS
jgi:acetyl esterase/lipase